MFVASHPRPVRDAIEQHRSALDEDPTKYLRSSIGQYEEELLQSAAEYLGRSARDIAVTDSTTMGLGLVYTGLKLSADQEVLTTAHDYYATRESLRLASERTGARIREIELYKQVEPQMPPACPVVREIRRRVLWPVAWEGSRGVDDL